MAPQNQTVRAPSGTSEASVGTRLHPVDLTGAVQAPSDDAAALLAIPGFTTDTLDEPPAGFARVFAPAGCDSLSYAGTTYAVTDGSVIIPCAAVGDLESHGFTAAPVEDGVELAPAEPNPAEAPDPAAEAETAAKAAAAAAEAAKTAAKPKEG